MENKTMIFLLEEIKTSLFRQYEKMADMRIMYEDVKQIQELHWKVLYVGNLVRMQQLIEQGIKELKQENEPTNNNKQ